MSVRVTIELDINNYATYTGGVIAIPLSERQAALLSTALQIMYVRSAWGNTTDSEWDAIRAEISEISELITP